MWSLRKRGAGEWKREGLEGREGGEGGSVNEGGGGRQGVLMSTLGC